MDHRVAIQRRLRITEVDGSLFLEAEWHEDVSVVGEFGGGEASRGRYFDRY